MPNFVFFEGVKCAVVAWLPATVCFQYGSEHKWRCHSAVEVEK